MFLNIEKIDTLVNLGNALKKKHNHKNVKLQLLSNTTSRWLGNSRISRLDQEKNTAFLRIGNITCNNAISSNKYPTER